jgi:hypothetical protein
MTEHTFLTPRQIIDPHGTLPHVELELNPNIKQKGGSLLVKDMLILHKGEQVGKFTLLEELKRKNAWFNGIEVEQKGKGFGMATYLTAIEQAHAKGETFRTQDWTQSEGAVKVWTKFIDAGIAEVIEPFIIDTEGVNAGKYTGEAVIRPPVSPTSTGLDQSQENMGQQ